VKPALIANENFPLPAVRLLRAEGWDVIWVLEAMRAASDREVLVRARAEQRWLLTFDRDYGELVFVHGEAPPPAILYLRQDPYPAETPARMVMNALTDLDFLRGHLVVLKESGIRRRAFPLRSD
jgi:predicted nuclease of predicted toxin-antitoxin system